MEVDHRDRVAGADVTGPGRGRRRFGGAPHPAPGCVPGRTAEQVGERSEHPPSWPNSGGSADNGAAADRVAGGVLLRRTGRSRARMPVREETRLLDGVAHLPFRRVAGGMLCSYWNTLYGSYCALISRSRSKLDPQ
ncbi:hypothetical protein GCM10022207_43410 [Streptomyces lannensis]|uniref:Uncharacterized protein n=1 Tax=Streptomyces lannensis TaxID=766498 RepID=A0ABP7KCS4_9ACTN